jgi:hypothetical protein
MRRGSSRVQDNGAGPGRGAAITRSAAGFPHKAVSNEEMVGDVPLTFPWLHHASAEALGGKSYLVKQEGDNALHDI